MLPRKRARACSAASDVAPGGPSSATTLPRDVTRTTRRVREKAIEEIEEIPVPADPEQPATPSPTA